MPASSLAPAWTQRAIRALHDPVWTADGYASSTWRPVSPVSGRIDAFVWQTPVASLPAEKNAAIEPSPFEEAMLAPPAPRREPSAELPAPAPLEPAGPVVDAIEPEPKGEPAAAGCVQARCWGKVRSSTGGDGKR